MITQGRLQEILYYHPSSGDWVWLVSRGTVKAGTQAGTFHAGYTRISIDQKLFLGHRLAVLYMTGAWPTADVDHEDLDRGNSAWTNIRNATRSQNQANTTARASQAGVKGVHQHYNKWRAYISFGGKRKHLGLFGTLEEAAAARNTAALQLHGQFARAL